MSEFKTVKLLRGHWPEEGKKIAPGTVIDMPADLADELIAKGIAEGDADQPPTHPVYEGMTAELKAALEIDLDALVEYRANQSEATRNIYEGDFRRFETWCKSVGEKAMPTKPETLCRYLITLAKEGKELGTLRRAASAISFIHALSRKPPTSDALVSAVMSELKHKYYAARLEHDVKLGGMAGAMAKRQLAKLGRREKLSA